MLILIPILNACETKIYRPSYNLPDFPLAGEEVSDELHNLCKNNAQNCKNINDYLNRLFKFKTIYEVYKPIINKN